MTPCRYFSRCIYIHLLLLIFLSYKASSFHRECLVESQPQYINDLISRYHTTATNSSNNCIFSKTSGLEINDLFNVTDGAKESILDVSELPSVPQSQRWCRCQQCGWKNNVIQVFTSNLSSNEHDYMYLHPISWSQWGEFFSSSSHHDRYYAQEIRLDDNIMHHYLYIVDRPVYILPIITFHVGHILVDVLESLYNSMMKAYGTIRRDSLLIFDVAGSEERKILQEKIYLNAGGVYDNFANILQLFTDLPIITTAFFDSIPSNTGIFFYDLHVGLDISDSYYAYGHAYHPMILDIDQSIFLQQLSSKYRQFQSFLTVNAADSFAAGLDIDTSAWNTSFELRSSINNEQYRILFIQRAKDRVIIGLDDFVEHLCGNNTSFQCYIVDLMALSFSSQLKLFASVDMIVASAGTAIHNIIFCRPYIDIIILMQPGWCKYAWMYANQAVLLHMYPYILCHDNHTTHHYHTRHWAHSFWNQGPRMLKSEDIYINTSLLHAQILEIINKSSYDAQNMDIMNSLTKHEKVSPSYHMIDDDETIYHRDNVDKNKILYESFISHVLSIRISDEMRWKLEVMGEIGSVDEASLLQLGKDHLNLSICLHFMDVIDFNPICIPIYQFSYYSDLILMVDHPILKIHTWIQTTSTINQTRIIGTDNFIVLDASLSSGGIELWLYAPDISLSFMIHHHMNEVSTVELLTQESSYHHHVNTSIINFQYNKSDDRLGLQKYLHHICIIYHLNHVACMYITQAVAASLYSKSFPAIQHLPSPQHPFIFLHIEKTAGTTLREFIYEGAETHGLQHYIPCHGDIHCATFYIHQHPMDLSNVSIVAGHFAWEVWQHLPSYHSNNISSSSLSNPSCLVIGRHPVDRIISYYYQRCYQSYACIGRNRSINELSPHELTSLITSARESVLAADNITYILSDEGMMDSACRTMINKRISSGMIIGIDDISLPEPLSVADHIVAIDNIQHCTIGLVEDWNATISIIHHFYPWIAFDHDRERKQMSIVKGKETILTIRPDLAQIIIDHNQCDMKLHQRMVDIFHRESSYLRLVHDLSSSGPT